jgi:hypothetical protein
VEGELKKNLELAFRFYRMAAAEKKSAQALFKVGICYHKGKGVELDDYEAKKYFKLAAEKAEVDELLDFGQQFEEGDGVEKNMEEAFRLYKTGCT